MSVPLPPGSSKPQATTKMGYELEIVALGAGEEGGKTKLVLPVGSIPDLRLRATPSLAKGGETVMVGTCDGERGVKVPRGLKPGDKFIVRLQVRHIVN